MTQFVFTGLWGNWPLTIVLCVLIIAVTTAEFVYFLRTRSNSDALVADWIRRILMALVVCACILCPTTITSSKSMAVKNIDIFFAVDITGSMAVTDAYNGPASTPQTRLGAARSAVTTIVANNPGSRYAGVSFGTSSTLGVPPTSDHLAIDNWARDLRVEPTGISSGSSLDEPLDTLIRTMSSVRSERPHDAIVLYLLTDGENTAPRERRTFTALRQFVDGGAVMAVGSTHGGTVPLITPANATQLSAAHPSPVHHEQWVTDPSTHKPAISKMSASTLKSIADEVSIPFIQLSRQHSAAHLPQAASRGYALEQSETRRIQRHILIWPFACVLFALVVWEFVVDIVRVRRHL